MDILRVFLDRECVVERLYQERRRKKSNRSNAAHAAAGSSSSSDEGISTGSGIAVDFFLTSASCV